MMIELSLRGSSLPLSIGFGGRSIFICIVSVCKKIYCTFVSIRRRVGPCAATCLSYDFQSDESVDIRHV